MSQTKSAKSKDFYQVLQVQPDADPAVIQAAYRSLSKKYHPDLNKDDQSEEQMKLLNEAYGVLCDAERRKNYDATLLVATKPAPKRKAAASAAKTSTTPKPRPARPKQRKDWLEDDYAYPRPNHNPHPTVSASQRDFSAANPRARDYKFRSVSALGRQLEHTILTYGPLDAWWLARHVSDSHTVGIVTKNEVTLALNAAQGRIFKIAWTDNGRPVWDLII